MAASMSVKVPVSILSMSTCDWNGAPSNADGYGFTVRVGLRRPTGVAKDMEIQAHDGHEGGVDYQVDGQLSWFVECYLDQG